MKATDIIRKDALEFIMNDISITLSRLGIHDKFEDMTFEEDKKWKTCKFQATIPDIRTTPMIFKRLSLIATIYVQPGQEDDEYNHVSVNLRFSFTSFNNGLNGTEIGNVKYGVRKNIPEQAKFKDLGYYYIVKEESLKI